MAVVISDDYDAGRFDQEEFGFQDDYDDATDCMVGFA
jgi:hypothetical protein